MKALDWLQQKVPNDSNLFSKLNYSVCLVLLKKWKNSENYKFYFLHKLRSLRVCGC